MKKYLSIFRIHFLLNLQYRIAAIAGVSTQFFWGAFTILMFQAFYETKPSAFPMSFESLCSYIWMQQAFLSLFMVWFLDNKNFEMIENGSIAYELCRPIDLYRHWAFKEIAHRLSKVILRCIPLLIVALILPHPYRLILSHDYLVWLSTIISFVFGFLLVVSFCMLIYIGAFYTVSPFGLKLLASTLVEFMAGAIIPLPFLPQSVQKVFEFLPFASMQNAPLRIFAQDIPIHEVQSVILLQIFWLCVFVIAGKYLMKKALTKVVVQGG